MAHKPDHRARLDTEDHRGHWAHQCPGHTGFSRTRELVCKGFDEIAEALLVSLRPRMPIDRVNGCGRGDVQAQAVGEAQLSSKGQLLIFLSDTGLDRLGRTG